MHSSSILKDAKKMYTKLGKAVMKSHRLRIPKYDLPLRFRPWFFVFTCFIMVILAFLGFTNFSRALPLNDKILHFLCFGIATGVFYFIIDVDESARRVWFWRHCGLILTIFTCLFCGGVLSEFVQATLPYKQFDWFDVLANLCGASLGLYVSYNVERYYRRRREIARLYQPLSGSYSDVEDDLEDSTDYFPLPTANSNSKPTKNSRAADVWDEREELFDLGDDSDEEYYRNRASGTNGPPPPQTPRIVVTHS